MAATARTAQTMAPAAAGAGETSVYFFTGRAVHPVYREQMDAVPEGFRYVPSHPDLVDASVVKRDIASRGTVPAGVASAAKRAAARIAGPAGYVRRMRVAVPDGAALVHSGQFLLRAPATPYVVDLEEVSVFSLYQRGALDRPWARRRLATALLHPLCRGVLPWSDAARRGLLTALGRRAAAAVAPKVTTVRLAARPRTDRPRRRTGGPLRLLFVGSTFFGKGGVEAIRAARRARESHDVELDLVTFAPDSWRRELEGDAAVRLHSRLSGEAMEELYARADALLFPSHTDTYGFVVNEAMARAVPVIASRHYALPELVEDHESGLVVDAENSLYGADGLYRFASFLPTRYPRAFMEALGNPSDGYVDRLASAIATLAGDDELYARLSAGALARVSTGPLSMDHRRQLLGEVYAAAV